MKRPANESNVGWAAREGRLQDAMERVVGTGETKGNKGILLANVGRGNVWWQPKV